jgi:hypothetical protein
MKCTDVRAALPLLIYGEPSADEKAALNAHLAGCAACRRERLALEGVRRLLDSAPVPPVEVDLPRLYQTQAARQAQRLRRWRRAALIAGTVAALLLLVVGLRLEVHLESGQMVVRWGEPPSTASSNTDITPTHVTNRRDAYATETEAELRLLSDLIHALKRDADDRDQRFAERLARLQAQVQAIRSQADDRWNATEQDVAALYLLTRKGDKP